MNDWRSKFREPTDTRWKQTFKALSKREVATFGADNPSPAEVQRALNLAGADPQLAEDGVFGPASQAAVKTFQSSHGLTADGVAGPQTLAALGFAGATGIGSGTISTAITSAGQSLAALVTGTAIWPSVLAAFQQFSGNFEGNALPYMYTDVKGLVTTGTGNLIDPIGAALTLPWRRPDGSLASQAEVIAAWTTVKNAWPGVQSTACASLTNLRLDKAGLDALVAKQLKVNDAYLQQRYPGYSKWPADAQLALHSRTWAAGPGVHSPAFDAAVNRPKPDFVTAATQIHLNDAGNPGLVPRNAANKQLMLNAAEVQAKGASPSTLYYPGPVVTGIGIIGGALAGGSLGVLLFFLWQDGYLQRFIR